MTQRLLAAAARSANVRNLADRPSQRRADEHVGSLPLVRMRSRIELRAADNGANGALHFHGVASATDKPYEMYDAFGPYTELVTAGAFGKTLAQEGLDVPLVLAHDSLRRIARTTNGTLTLTEQLAGDDAGLHVDAPNLDPMDADVAYIAPKLRSGLVDEMSFRFVITRGQWSSDWTEYHIQEVDLNRGDVAIVGYGASPHTSGELRAPDVDPYASRSDDYVMHAYREARAALRARGLRPPMSLEDVRSA